MASTSEDAFGRLTLAVPVSTAEVSPLTNPLKLTPAKLAASDCVKNRASLLARTLSGAGVMLAANEGLVLASA